MRATALWQGLAAWRTRRRERRRTAGSLEQLQPASRHQRCFRVAVIYVVAVGICGFLDLRGFDFLEQYAQHVRLGAYARRNGSLAERARNQIVLVTISDDSFAALPGPPIPRNHHAKVIRDLTRAGAEVIAFDLVFDLPSPHDPALAAAARASGKVLWACVFENPGQPEQRIVLPVPPLRQASPRWGHIVVPQDPDIMAIDRLEACLLHQGHPMPALSLKAALMALGLENQPIRRVARGWQIGDLLVPVDEKGRSPIRFLGRPEEVFPVVAYEQVYDGAVDDEFYRQNQFFRDKIVLIGDTTTIGNDHRFTPVGDMWGVEIHAHALATLLQRGFVREMPEWVNLIVLLLLAALVCPIVASCRLSCAALATVGLLVGYGVINVWLFVDYRVLLHLVGPAAAMGFTALGALLERGLTEEREKTRMRGLLQRYLSPQTAEYVLAHPEKCHLGGEQVVATVLFSDIRGFTAMAEKWTPEEVVARLNEYFQAMTDIVFQYDSAVDKYMGDALMALFGIPVPHPDHPRRAVAAAIDMQTALRELQAQWQAQGLPLIDIGIGINTGEMVVGNIGSKERQDFTVIGDAVNLASRVESLNKELHTRILITAATYEFIQDEVEVRGPLIMHVRGREEEVIVYEVLGWRNATADASGAAKNGSRERAQRIVPGFPGPTKIGPGSRVR